MRLADGSGYSSRLAAGWMTYAQRINIQWRAFPASGPAVVGAGTGHLPPSQTHAPPVTNPRRGQTYATVVFGVVRGENVGASDVNWRTWLISEERTSLSVWTLATPTVLLWLRSSCLDAKRPAGTTSQRASCEPLFAVSEREDNILR